MVTAEDVRDNETVLKHPDTDLTGHCPGLLQRRAIKVSMTVLLECGGSICGEKAGKSRTSW